MAWNRLARANCVNVDRGFAGCDNGVLLAFATAAAMYSCITPSGKMIWQSLFCRKTDLTAAPLSIVSNKDGADLSPAAQFCLMFASMNLAFP